MSLGSFPIQMQMFDDLNIEDDITDLEAELHDEEQLSANLGADSAQKIADAKSFIEKNGEIVLDQHARLMVLNQNLRAIVQSNKTKQTADGDYHELVNSEEYLTLATKMSEIKAMVQNIKDFLIKEGVRGRTPI